MSNLVRNQNRVIMGIWVVMILAVVMIFGVVCYIGGANTTLRKLDIDLEVYSDWINEVPGGPVTFSHEWEDIHGTELITDPVVLEDARIAGRNVRLYVPKD